MVHFVGAGPGDPELMTLKGMKLIEKADILIYAGSLVDPRILKYAKEGCSLYDSALLSLEEIIDIIEKGVKEGKEVVRLHSGDPALYGSVSEQTEELDKRNISYDCCPGVSSLFGAAAALKKEFMIPGKSQSLIVTRLSGRTPVPEKESLSLFASHGCSIAVFLSAGMADRVSSELISGGFPPEAPAAIVYKASREDQKCVLTTVSGLGNAARENNIDKTAIIFAGEFLSGCGERSCLYDPSFSTLFREASPKHKDFISIISFTDKGHKLNERLSEAFINKGEDVCSVKGIPEEKSLDEVTCEAFKGKAVIFIGAAGIAFRASAPHIAGKDKDPSVSVIDENGKYVIPLLSGHIGGGNELALKISSLIGGEAVITTATDINGVFAVDNWAAEKGLKIENKGMIKSVSSAVLRGEKVFFQSDLHSDEKALVSDGVPESVISKDPECPVRVRISPRIKDGAALNLVPKCLVLGIGCRKDTEYSKLREFVKGLLSSENIHPSAISDIVSIDLKEKEQAIIMLGEETGVPLSFYSASELNEIPGDFDIEGSYFVLEKTGSDNVCERAAIKKTLQYSDREDVKLLVKKSKGEGITGAVALFNPFKKKRTGTISVVGLGPGGREGMTMEAVLALRKSRFVTGYRVYLDLVKDLISDKEVYESGMREEEKRCVFAMEKALLGYDTAVVCSGDPGVYGMAGLIYEVCAGHPEIEIRVIPGVTAALSAGAILGAPLMNDFAVISLSDLMTPWEIIEKRLRSASEGDLVTVLYNPMSKKRRDHLKKAVEIIRLSRAADTVCGFVRNAGREGESFDVCTLGELAAKELDMFTTVIIGNNKTRLINGRMVTDRGYRG